MSAQIDNSNQELLQIREPDSQIYQSLHNDDEAYPSLPDEGLGHPAKTVEERRHGKLVVPKTPEISMGEVNWLPSIRVHEWLNHTSKMLLLEWFPVTYFALAGVIAPKDSFGCGLFSAQRIEKLMTTVFGPLLFFRFCGLIFMNKPKLIIYQILIIYGYFVVSLTLWDINTLRGMHRLAPECYHPLHVSMLNLMTMEAFYIFMVCPYLTIFLVLPYYMYLVFQYANQKRQRKLAKHYLIKAMPSIIFDKKLFEKSSYQECAICMESFQEKEDYVTPLACDARHFYHSDCIQEWLSNKNECPLCKKLQTPKMMRSFSQKFMEKQKKVNK